MAAEVDDRLILALPNGRILAEVMPLLRRAGVEPEPAFEDPASRRLRFATSEPDLDLIRVRSFDVATFVAFGAAQLGVAGNDVLMEFDYSEIYAPLDLEIGHCHIAVAATDRLGRARGRQSAEPYQGRDKVPGDHAPPFRRARDPGGMHQAQRRDRAGAAPGPVPPYHRSGPDRRDIESERTCRNRADRRGQLTADRQPPGAEDQARGGRRLGRAVPRRGRRDAVLVRRRTLIRRTPRDTLSALREMEGVHRGRDGKGDGPPLGGGGTDAG